MIRRKNMTSIATEQTIKLVDQIASIDSDRDLVRVEAVKDQSYCFIFAKTSWKGR